MPHLKRPDTASAWGPMREWWVFNPGPRLGLCLNEGVFDFVFHQKTYQFKPNMAISPEKHLMLLGQNLPWRAMLIDYHEDLAILYTHERRWSEPAGVFPMWSAHAPTRRLREILERYPQPGESVGHFTGAKSAAYAMEGQEQRIVICNLPKGPLQWESVFTDVLDLKRSYPDHIFHFNGQKTIPRTLGVGVDSFDHPVTIDWIDGQPRLLMANGRLLDHKTYERTDDHTKWARLVGMQARTIFDQPDRTIKSKRMYAFNLRSLKWAFANYEQVWSGRIADESEVNVDDPDSSWVPINLMYRPRSNVATDKWICDLCSISARCPYFKPGALCIVDDTEAADLAAKFKTRNAQSVLEALGTLVAAGSTRTTDALKAEQTRNIQNPEEPKFSPEVTRMLAHTFDQGVTLARLLDPFLGVASGRGGRRSPIEGKLAGEVAGATTQELAADFKKELERSGIDIETLSAEDTVELLSRITPAGSIGPHVDEDTPSVDAGGGSHVAPSPPSFRAAPSVDP